MAFFGLKTYFQKIFLGYFCPPIKVMWKNWAKRASKWVFIGGVFKSPPPPNRCQFQRPLMVGLKMTRTSTQMNWYVPACIRHYWSIKSICGQKTLISTLDFIHFIGYFVEFSWMQGRLKILWLVYLVRFIFWLEPTSHSHTHSTFKESALGSCLGFGPTIGQGDNARVHNSSRIYRKEGKFQNF